MFVLLEVNHEAKTSEASIRILGIYESRANARARMRKEYQQTLEATGNYRPDSQSGCMSDEAWVIDEFCNHYDWCVLADDWRTWCYGFGGAYECGFDDKD